MIEVGVKARECCRVVGGGVECYRVVGNGMKSSDGKRDNQWRERMGKSVLCSEKRIRSQI